MELTNELFPVHIGSPIGADGLASGRAMTIPTGLAISLFRSLAIKRSDIVSNYFGLYTLGSIGRNKKVRFGSLNTPKHILSSRKNGCVWNPKGQITNSITDIELCPVEYNGEQCPDALWDSCWESILGTGNDVRDWLATVEGKALFGELMRAIYLGMGNSFYDLAWYGKNSAIEAATANNSYTVGEKEWADFVDQQEACRGWLTLDDALRHIEGLENFNVQIHPEDVDGDTYIGAPTELFERLKKQSTGNFRVALKSGQRFNGRKAPIIVTQSIFDAYEKELLQTWGKIDAMFYYSYNGKFCEKLGCIEGEQIPGVLLWKGHPVISMDEWGLYDEMTGMISHRAILTVPGNYGMAYDIPELSQFDGMGMRINQRLEAPYQGKIYMDTTFEMGTAILNTDLMTSAALILEPEN